MVSVILIKQHSDNVFKWITFDSVREYSTAEEASFAFHMADPFLTVQHG